MPRRFLSRYLCYDICSTDSNQPTYSSKGYAVNCQNLKLMKAAHALFVQCFRSAPTREPWYTSRFNGDDHVRSQWTRQSMTISHLGNQISPKELIISAPKEWSRVNGSVNSMQFVTNSSRLSTRPCHSMRYCNILLFYCGKEDNSYCATRMRQNRS